MIETDYLICPICGSELQRVTKSYLCTAQNSHKRHCFDIASSGYADLSYRNGGSGDPKDAVIDRTAFLDKGYYQPLSDEINNLCSAHLPDSFVLLDAGCGEGYYSERIASSFVSSYILGADLSKHAVHRASVRRNMRGGSNSFYCVSSIFAMPVRDSSADCVLSMFAPIATDEISRVLKDDGILIIGAAGVRHLYELKEAIYSEVHLNDVREDLPSLMTLIDKTNVSYMIEIDNAEDINRLFGMTPYRYRTSEKSLRLLEELKTLKVKIDVDFYVYKK